MTGSGPDDASNHSNRDASSDGAGDGPRDDAFADSGDEPTRDATTDDASGLRWFFSDDENAVVIRDVAMSVAIVAGIGLILFAVSGVWPPLVAVESGSMEPQMHRGDLIFVAEEDRFVGEQPVADTGIVTAYGAAGEDDGRFGGPGDVIIFIPDGNPLETPVIHRAHFWVEDGENWTETKANEEYLGGKTCGEIAACPAEQDGFVTMGDNNDGYDQAGFGADTDHVVSPEWITGKGLFRIPWLGYIRLTFDTLFMLSGPTSLAGLSAGAAGLVTVGAVGRR